MNRSDCERIHETSLSLLADPGVKLEHDEICERLLKSGARPGHDSQVIRFPREMVEEYLRLAPPAITLTDRAGGRVEVTAASEPVYWTCPGMNLARGAEARPFTSDDMGRVARLADALEHVHGCFGMALDDVPPEARDFVGLRIMAENTRKHLRALSFTARGCEAMIEMRKVLGDHAWFSIGFTAHGPLRWTHLALDIYLKSAGHGVPATVNGEPMAGATGPVALAGSLAVGNAEILAGIVLNQVLEPGRPCIHNLGLAHVMDMRRALAVTGGPENHLMAVAAAGMGRLYNLPSASWVSTESMLPDAQAAMEKMLGFHTHTSAGASLIWGVGQLESEVAISLAQMVIDNEMIGLVKRFARGIEVDDSTLLPDVVREVGISGSFLMHEHTLTNYREHLHLPDILCRQRRENWAAEGAKTLAEVAQEKADALIAGDGEACVNEDEKAALLAIEKRYRR